nr:unnamed protein product [Callosobruchus analis]
MTKCSANKCNCTRTERYLSTQKWRSCKGCPYDSLLVHVAEQPHCWVHYTPSKYSQLTTETRSAAEFNLETNLPI